MAVDLKDHPGLNPEYHAGMEARREALAINASRRKHGGPLVPVPKQPNKYVPHIGAKQRSRGSK